MENTLKHNVCGYLLEPKLTNLSVAIKTKSIKNYKH